MTCYVDTVRHYSGAGLRFTDFCHLLADDPEELHAMAAGVGMPRRFFQQHPWRWHYDLPAHLRVEAVALGAREVDLAFVGQLLKTRRAQYRLTAATGGTEPPAGDDPPSELVP